MGANTKDAPTSNGVVVRNLADLTVHPLAARMPMLAEDAPEMQALLVSVELHGLGRQPIIIDGRDRIMDGRHRRVVCKLAGLLQVPCIVRPEEEAPSIIVESLVGRRHYTKGARAYLAAPLLSAAAEANKEARAQQLLSGANPRNPTELVFGKTEGEFAAQLGFSDELARQAKEVQRKFAAADQRIAEWRKKYPDVVKEMRATDPAKFPLPEWASPFPDDLRARFEPEILSGSMGLGAVLQAVAGLESTKGSPRQDRPKAALIFQSLRTMQMRFGYWADLDPGEQEEAERLASEAFAALPENVRLTIITADAKSR